MLLNNIPNQEVNCTEYSHTFSVFHRTYLNAPVLYDKYMCSFVCMRVNVCVCVCVCEHNVRSCSKIRLQQHKVNCAKDIVLCHQHFCWNFNAHLRLQLLRRKPYFGTFLPSAVTIKRIRYLLRKSCSTLVTNVGEICSCKCSLSLYWIFVCCW